MCRVFLCFILLRTVLAIPLEGLPLSSMSSVDDIMTSQLPPNSHHVTYDPIVSVTSEAVTDKAVKIQFAAHGRSFRLSLRRAPQSVFSSDVEFHTTSGRMHFDVSRVYTGVLEGDPGSTVEGILTSEGIFDGTVLTSNGELWYLEPIARYRTDNDDTETKTQTSDLIKTQTDNMNNIDTHSVVETQTNVMEDVVIPQTIVKTRTNMESVIDSVLKIQTSKINTQTDMEETIVNTKNDKEMETKTKTKKTKATPPIVGNTLTTISETISKSPTKTVQQVQTSEEITTAKTSTQTIITNGIVKSQTTTIKSQTNIATPQTDGVKLQTNTPVTVKPQTKTPATVKPQTKTPVTVKSNTTSLSVHSVIYRADKVPRDDHETNCASQRLHEKVKAENTNSRVKRWLPDDILQHDHVSDTPRLLNPELPLDLDVPYTRNTKIDHNIVNKKPTATLIGDFSADFRHVNKRATVDPKKTTCMLYLQADHKLFSKLGSEESCIEVMTRHVQRVNHIYRVTDFNQDSKPDNITFMIKRIKVHTSESLNDPDYRYHGDYGVEKFLELFSEEDYDSFCLAYMFTYRDFEMGTLGLAWTGDLKNAGGVCEKNGHYRGSMKSLNTGIVTLLNYGKRVPPAVSHVTLAHEIGHNFGSPHDPEQCTPGGEDGNYIMFARATSGDKANNNRFSTCSLKAISLVLNVKARSAKGCFTEPQSSICGNGVVEPGEQCDCGWEQECRDSCCHPQSRYPAPNAIPCQLTPGAVCSPSQGPCCTEQCQLRFGDKCRSDNGCRDASYCAGRSPQCPPSLNKPNKTICNEEFVCFMGECTGSICLAYGLESCQCAPQLGDPPTKACELCCRVPAESGGPPGVCKSSYEWNDAPYDVPDMHAKPGTPCNDYNGYCDVLSRCREVDPSGPLATLRKLLLSEESLASIKKWVVQHWYAVALLTAALLAMLVISTKLLGKRPDVRLKSVTIMHPMNPSEQMNQVLPPDLNAGQVIVHTAVRSKVPLKRRVRDAKFRSKKTRRNNNNSSEQQQAQQQIHQQPQTTSNVVVKHRKKKRVSAPVVAEESRKRAGDNAVLDAVPFKNKKISTLQRNNKVKKEVIDYSQTQIKPKHNSDALGKVQQWLMDSPQPKSVIPKSKSTPVGLIHRSPNKLRTVKNRNDKCKSVGNLQDKEKMRLQVVYKPPFKFSLQLCKSDHSKVVRLNENDKIRKKMRYSKDLKENVHPLRTAILVKTKDDHDSKQNGDCTTNATDIAVNIINIPTNSSSNKNLTKDNNTKTNDVKLLYENVLACSSVEQKNVRSSKRTDKSSSQQHLVDSDIRSRQNSLTNLQSSNSNLHSRHNLNSCSNLQHGSSAQNLIRNSSQDLHNSSSQQNLSVSRDNANRSSAKHFNNRARKLKRQLSVSDINLSLSQQRANVVSHETSRPNTSQCDGQNEFKWPETTNNSVVNKTASHEQTTPTIVDYLNVCELYSEPIYQPLQSDLEVLLSDNETPTEHC